MYYSSSSKQAYPDLNYFYNPYYVHHPYPSVNPLFPRQVKIVVLQKEEEDKIDKTFLIDSSHSFQLNGKDKSEKSENFDKNEKHSLDITHISDNVSFSDTEQSHNSNKTKFTVTKSNFSNVLLTEFNNYKKLKKINSSYHLKRKISTKLQNEIKDSINSLITEANSELKICNINLPFMSCNSKEFRENVKNEFVKLFGNQTIAKYASEDVMIVRKFPTSSGRENNKLLMEKIQKIYTQFNKCQPLKKLICLLNKTLVKDFYTEFLNSKRYKKCLEKDVRKYSQKLEKLKLSEEKRKIFKEIYYQKYDGVAKSLFL